MERSEDYVAVSEVAVVDTGAGALEEAFRDRLRLVERAPGFINIEVLFNAAPALAELATQRLYAEQPQLERMGVSGREHTVEGRFCVGLFDARGFPQKWLTDAWRHIEAIITDEMEAAIAVPAVAVLSSGLAAASTHGEA
ncbi:MAG: hypothetical protein ACR2MY_10600 [Candidatus Dormibacteria bacterium]